MSVFPRPMQVPGTEKSVLPPPGGAEERETQRLEATVYEIDNPEREGGREQGREEGLISFCFGQPFSLLLHY